MDDLGNRDGNQTLRDAGTVSFLVDDDTNRYTSIGGTTITHDDAGNLTRDRQNYRYEYDYENRIARIYKLSGETQITVASFDYDALGHRVRKIDAVAGQTTLYYNDPEWRILAEYDAANNQLRKYVYGNYLDETLRMTDSYAGDGTPTGDYYFLHDHLYSPAVLLSSAGAVVERYEYDSYGTRHVFDQNFGTRANTNFGVYVAFQGHIHDRLDSGNLNLLDARYRTYDPFAGRWLMYDKLGMMQGEQRYANYFNVRSQYLEGNNLYVGLYCNPISYFDIFGLWGPYVHFHRTQRWAERVGFSSESSKAIATADEAVDSLRWGGTGPVPWGDPAYHFNRDLSGLSDTRLGLSNKEFQSAMDFCRPILDLPEIAAKYLGVSFHPLQDWYAHGDYAMRENPILTIHNSQSPQHDYGNPADYPDRVDLDVKDSPDGRPTRNYLIFELFGPQDYAIYEPGFKRYEATRADTMEHLKEYYDFILREGGCKCKKYFGVGYENLN